VGQAYVNHVRLALHSHSFSFLDEHLAAERERKAKLEADDAAGEDDLGVGDEEETPELLSLDPKEWKVCWILIFDGVLIFPSQKQDHYAVLGLSHLRYEATAEHIKIARMYIGYYWSSFSESIFCRS